MNYGMIRFVLLRAMQLIGYLMALPFAVALMYREYQCAVVFAGVSLALIAIGILNLTRRPENTMFFAREGFVMTALIWIMMSVVGALPFVLTGVIPHPVDAVFETVSGFTTTGASILSGVGGMYYSVQFWRCFTHWIGGMGVLVFMLAVLPRTDSSIHLMRAESPGPSVGKFVPHVASTARLLYYIYIAFTLIEAVLLRVTGMNWYESFTLTFSTVGTGGFSITDHGINPYPVASQCVIILFMIMCGVNFNTYYLLQTGRVKDALKSEEVRWYLVILFGAAAVIGWNVYRTDVSLNLVQSFHHALFTVSSIMTTTGFATLDYNHWPQLSKSILFLLMLIGACAGSTGGGFKVSRLIIVIKRLKNEMTFTTHPKSVRQVYMDGRRVQGTIVKSVMAYLGIYAVIYLVSFLLISIDGFDFETTFSAVAATMNNIGPGFNLVGPTGNFGIFSDFSKLVLTFDMLAGRLEFLPVLILFRRKTYIHL